MYFLCLGSWSSFHKISKTHHWELPSTVTFPTLHTATMEICLWYLLTDYFYSTVNLQFLQFDEKFMIKRQNTMWNTEFNDIFGDSELQSYWHWSYLITLIDYGVILQQFFNCTRYTTGNAEPDTLEMMCTWSDNKHTLGQDSNSKPPVHKAEVLQLIHVAWLICPGAIYNQWNNAFLRLNTRGGGGKDWAKFP